MGTTSRMAPMDDEAVLCGYNATVKSTNGLVDIGSDGFVSCVQLRCLFKNLRNTYGGPLSDADIDAVLRAVDRRGDGFVHYAEFVTWLVFGDEPPDFPDPTHAQAGLSTREPEVGHKHGATSTGEIDRRAMEEVERIAKAEAQRRMAEFERRETQRRAHDIEETQRKAHNTGAFEVKKEAGWNDKEETVTRGKNVAGQQVKIELECESKHDGHLMVKGETPAMKNARPATMTEAVAYWTREAAERQAKKAAEKAAIESEALHAAASRARDKIECKVREEVRRRMYAFGSNEAEHNSRDEAPIMVKEEVVSEATGPTPNWIVPKNVGASEAVNTRWVERTTKEEGKNAGGEVKRKAAAAPDFAILAGKRLAAELAPSTGKRLAAELAPSMDPFMNTSNKRSQVVAANREASGLSASKVTSKVASKVTTMATAVPGSPASDSAARVARGLADQDGDLSEEPEGDVAAALKEAALSAMAAAHDPKASQARLIDLLSGDVHKLPRTGVVAVGRRASCEVVVSMPCVSSRHCVLTCTTFRVELKDVSSFGTYVNSKLVPKDCNSDHEPPHVVLHHGDLLTLARRHGPPALLFLEASGSV